MSIRHSVLPEKTLCENVRFCWCDCEVHESSAAFVKIMTEGVASLYI